LKGHAAIVNSRQRLYPLGCDAWIKNSEKAVKYAVENNLTLLTSVGMSSWELVLYLASKYHARQKVYVKSESSLSFLKLCEDIEKDFNLDTTLVEWCPVKVESSGQKGTDEFRTKRDRLIISEADAIIPVSIRVEGNLKRLIIAVKVQGMDINKNFECSYDGTSSSCKNDYGAKTIRDDVDGLLSEYLIHWTRAAHKPWPNELAYDYYKAVIESTDEYSHSAKQTLIRILSEGKLRASSRHMRAGIRAVSLSGLEPSQAVRLMKWRARYREMSFEPYGIAIHKEAARELGVRKVYYGNPEMYQYLEEDNRPYFQNIGTKGDWMPEKEYRYIGDLNLDSISSESVIVICRSKSDTDQLNHFFNGQILCIYDD